MLPNLDHIDMFACDIETKDIDLKELGPGPRRQGNYILGVAISTKDKNWYFSLNHPESNNIQEEKFFNWFKQYTNKKVVFANALYDCDWLQYHGIKFTNSIYDVQIAEPLLNENAFKYDLDTLGKKYLEYGKEKDEITDICKANKWSGDPRKYLWRLNSNIVGKYAKIDTRLTFDIFEKQLPELEKQDLLNIFYMETKLLPLLLKMRKIGVRIDLDKRDKLIKKYGKIVGDLKKELFDMVGFDVNIYAPRSSIKQAFDKLGLKYSYTEKGNPTFSRNVLEHNQHTLPQTILKLRMYDKAYKDFILGIGKFLIGDRLHTEFHPMRGDKYGTVSGRFSSSRPNLQNQPARYPEIAKDIRSMFISEPGYKWLRGDYSQIELRMLAHYARGIGADQIREAYNKDPNTDFHQIGADIVGIKRKPAKNINFGVVYGMGKEKLKKTLGLPDKEAEDILSLYCQKLPFLKKTSYDCSSVALRRGYVKTILGRRRRFVNKNLCYKALNSVLQGSAADIIKSAMVKAYEAGVFDVILPHLTVHDEMDCSYKNKDIGAVKEMKNIFENTIKFKIPIIFELESGDNWANLGGLDL